MLALPIRSRDRSADETRSAGRRDSPDQTTNIGPVVLARVSVLRSEDRSLPAVPVEDLQGEKDAAQVSLVARHIAIREIRFLHNKVRILHKFRAAVWEETACHQE